MGYILCLQVKNLAVEMVNQHLLQHLLLLQQKAVNADTFIMAVYMIAVILFKRFKLIPSLFIFMITLLFFQSELVVSVKGYQVHLIYLIIFSLPVKWYHRRHKGLFTLISLMVLFQGVMAVDAILYNYETVLYTHYPAIITCLHLCIVTASFWDEKFRRLVGRLFSKLCSVKIGVSDFINNRNSNQKGQE